MHHGGWNRKILDKIIYLWYGPLVCGATQIQLYQLFIWSNRTNHTVDSLSFLTLYYCDIQHCIKHANHYGMQISSTTDV